MHPLPIGNGPTLRFGAIVAAVVVLHMALLTAWHRQRPSAATRLAPRLAARWIAPPSNAPVAATPAARGSVRGVHAVSKTSTPAREVRPLPTIAGPADESVDPRAGDDDPTLHPRFDATRPDQALDLTVRPDPHADLRSRFATDRLANAASRSPETRMARRLAGDGRWIDEILPDGTVRLRRGEDCLLARAGRAGGLDPYNVAFRSSPRAVEPC